MDLLLGHIFQDRRRRPTRREVVARLLLSALTMAVCFLSLTVTATFTHLMVQLGGNVSAVAAMVLGVLGVVLFIDTFANEVWPRRQRFPATTHFRQYLWLATGLLHELFAFSVFTSNLSTSLGVFLVMFGCGCFLLTFVDAAQEKTDSKCLS